MAQTRTAQRATDAQALIGRSARVRGRITGEGSLNVEGEVDGDISLRGDLMVGEGATVTSNVEAQTVTVAGTLEGDVHARGMVRIAAGAKVRGNVHGEQVALEEGAEFAGRFDLEFELPPELSGGNSARKRS